MTTLWGAYPYTTAIDWNVPVARIGYSAYTGRGLGNLQKDKLNLININWGYPGKYENTTLLCTDKDAYTSMLKTVCGKCKGYNVILVIENEPDNKNVITNTTPTRYINNLSWAKNVADGYGIPVMHGAVMQPAAYHIYQDTLPRDQKQEMVDYMRKAGLFIGGSTAAANARKELEFCASNGIMGNFHSQKDYRYLSGVIDALKTICEDISNNELGIRDGLVESVQGIVNAAQGRLTYASWYNMDLGKNAQEFNEPQKQAFLSMI